MSGKHRMIDINISKGNEYKTLVMDIYKETEFFHESFVKAAGVITEIVSTAAYCGGDQGHGESRLLVNYPNNIIAFCAERGQGKTSAMLSMADALRNLSGHDDEQQKNKFWNEKINRINFIGTENPVLNTGFEIIDPVDPTMMEKSDSIIKNVLSKMFKKAEEKWNSGVFDHHSKAFKSSQKEEMLQKFVACFRAADHLKRDDVNSSMSYDDLNLLAEYGDSASFRKSLYNLINLYLEFMSIGDGQKKTFLVIQIDDADLSIKNAHAISEEIRKYLVLPNVIVMMALNAETMRYTIEQYFLKQYQYYIELGNKEVIQDKCHDIMEKYIEKLLPAAHRVNIPKVDDYIRDGFNHIRLNYWDETHCKAGGSPEDLAPLDKMLLRDVEKKDHYQEKLISLIYQKTGIILVKPEYYLHEFLPSSMRMLNHFLTFIVGLDDLIYHKDGETIGTLSHIFKQIKEYGETKDEQIKDSVEATVEKNLSNLKKFHDYFLHTWCNAQLTGNDLRIINIISSTSRGKKIQRTVELLNSFCKSNEKVNNHVPFSAVIEQFHEMRTGGNLHRYLHIISAVEMYYTIYFHTVIFECIKSWLTGERMIESTPFNALVDLLGYSIFPLSYYDEKQIRRLRIKNPVGLKNTNYNANYRFFYHYLCEMSKEGDLIQYHKPVVQFLEEKNKFDFTGEYSYFDPFRPLVSILCNDDFAKDFLNAKGGLDAGIVSSALNIISSIDIQNLIYDKIFSQPEDNMNTSTEKGVADILSGLYLRIDDNINKNCVMKTESIWGEAARKVDGKDGFLEMGPLESLFKSQSATNLKGLYTAKGETASQFIDCDFPDGLFQISDGDSPSTQDIMETIQKGEQDDKSSFTDQSLNGDKVKTPEDVITSEEKNSGVKNDNPDDTKEQADPPTGEDVEK